MGIIRDKVVMEKLRNLLKTYLPLEHGKSWCLGGESLVCIWDSVGPDSITLETGIGYSTIVFAARQSKHTVCFPYASVEQNVREHAASADISMDRVTFLVGGSQSILPHMHAAQHKLPLWVGLDFGLIDGDHAWPIPIIDFYYIGCMTKVGGLILIDDLSIKSVRDTMKFIEPSRHWEIQRSLDDGRAVLIQKVSEGAQDWYGLQEYNYLRPVKYL